MQRLPAYVDDAFRLLDQVVEGRCRRGLTVVVDTLGLDTARREVWAAWARQAGLVTVAVVMDTPPAVCRARNASRDRPVPAAVLGTQLQRMREVTSELEREGWDVHVVSTDDPPPGPGRRTARPGPSGPAPG